MQFIPQKNEVYASMLRNTLQKRSFRAKSVSKLLKRILYFELFCISDEKTPTNIIEFCDKILGSALAKLIIKGYYFGTEFAGKGIKSVNRKAFSLVLCEFAAAAKNYGTIRVYVDSRKIIITADCTPIKSNTVKLIKNMGGMFFSSQNISGFYIILQNTDLPSGKIPDEFELLDNPYSVVRTVIDVIEDRPFG